MTLKKRCSKCETRDAVLSTDTPGLPRYLCDRCVDISSYHFKYKLIVAEDMPTSKDAPGIPMLLWCPLCHTRHIDEGEFATKLHHTHSCQECGLTWRPAIVNTVGVQFLPGFKNGV